MAEAAAAAVQDIGEIETRPGTRADHAFVFATALRNIKASTAFARRISNTVFFALHHQVFERILERGTLVIAHPAGDPQTILGYLLYERAEPGAKVAGVAVPEVILQMVYVKKTFRGFGVGRTLFRSERIVPGAVAFTHLTAPDGESLWRKYPTAEFWPYLLS
jgi:GNAT superfamily N-acetyltransferase